MNTSLKGAFVTKCGMERLCLYCPYFGPGPSGGSKAVTGSSFLVFMPFEESELGTGPWG